MDSWKRDNACNDAHIIFNIQVFSPVVGVFVVMLYICLHRQKQVFDNQEGH